MDTLIPADLRRTTGALLALSFVMMLVGVSMFWIRGGIRGGAPPSHAYFVWERSSIMAAVVLTAIGFRLLEAQLQNTDGRVLARVGATAYFFAGVLLVAAEASSLTQGFENNYPLIVVYVVLALLAQVAIGGALLQTGLLSAGIGWATLAWNVGWLVVLPVVTPGDIYFPILHHVMPLVMGIALLIRR